MSRPVLPQNEFFIYVPSLQKDEMAHDSYEGEKGNVRIKIAGQEAGSRAWVKVPLSEKICVYVSLTQAHEEIVCSN